MLKRAIAPLGYDIVLDDRNSDYNNVLSVCDGRNEIGITQPSFVEWADRKLSVFADHDIPDLRIIAALNLPVWLAAAVDRKAGFSTLRELAAAKYPWRAILPPEHNLIGHYIERIMREHGGITRESIVAWGGADLRPTYQKTAAERAAMTGPNRMQHTTAMQAKNGETNGFFLYINGCSQWARDLTSILDLKFLRFDVDILDAINADWGGTNITLPERLFPGVNEDITAVGWRHHYIYGRADCPDDLALAVLRALEDERILDNAHGFSYSGFRPHLVGKLQLHPASEAYYAKRQPG